MTPLQTFLATASPDPVVALTQAKNYIEQVGSLIPATTINQLFAQLDMTGVIADISEDPNHPARHKLKSVILSIQGNHDFNFILGKAAGDGNLLMLDWLIAGPMSAYAIQLSQFKSTVLSLANSTVKPFENITLHDVLVAREECPIKEISYQGGGFAVLSTRADCPSHRPRLLELRNGKWNRINSFENVSVAGVYECIVPAAYRGGQLAVDDPFGVI